MFLRYTGVTVGWLWEGMVFEVPTNWETSSMGNVTVDARSEIMDALWRKGLIFGNVRVLNHIYCVTDFGQGSFFLNWKKA